MDPDAALAELRELLRSMASYEGKDAFYLAGVAEEANEKFNALDEWIKKGGFLPKDWRKDG